MNTWLGILRVLAFVIGIGILLISLPNALSRQKAGLPGNFHLPGIAQEWTQSPQEANLILEKYTPPAIANRDINLDTWLIVPMYLLFFVNLALHLLTTGSRTQNILAMGVIVAVLIAAVADFIENHRTLALVEAFVQKQAQGGLNGDDQILLQQKFQAYVVKWMFLAIVLGFVGLIFTIQATIGGGLPNIKTAASLAIGIPNLAAAAFFALGLARSNSLVEWGFILFGVGAMAIGKFFL